MKHGPAYSRGIHSKMMSMMSNSTLIGNMPMLMPDLMGMAWMLIRPSPQAGKSRARVSQGIDAYAEQSHP